MPGVRRALDAGFAPSLQTKQERECWGDRGRCANTEREGRDLTSTVKTSSRQAHPLESQGGSVGASSFHEKCSTGKGGSLKASDVGLADPAEAARATSPAAPQRAMPAATTDCWGAALVSVGGRKVRG